MIRPAPPLRPCGASEQARRQGCVSLNIRLDFQRFHLVQRRPRSRDEIRLPSRQMQFGNADGCAVLPCNAEIAMKGPQLLNLGRQDQGLDAAVRTQVDAFAIGRKPGQLRHLEPLGFVRADQVRRPPRRLGFVRAQDQLGGRRAGKGDNSIATVDRPRLGHILKADDNRETALTSSRDQFFDLGLISKCRQFVGDNPDLLAANLRTH